jgi:hypothetical protein
VDGGSGRVSVNDARERIGVKCDASRSASVREEAACQRASHLAPQMPLRLDQRHTRRRLLACDKIKGGKKRNVYDLGLHRYMQAGNRRGTNQLVGLGWIEAPVLPSSEENLSPRLLCVCYPP